MSSDLEVFNAYSSLQKKAEDGSLRSGNEVLSVLDLTAYIAISSYFAKYPRPEYAFMALSQIPTVLKNCDAYRSCAPLVKARSETARLMGTTNAALSKIINCNELGDEESCRAKLGERYRYSSDIAPISMLEPNHAARIQSDLLILKSTGDLTAETPARIDLFMKRVSSSRKAVVYFKTSAHSLSVEKPAITAKTIKEFWNQECI